MTILELKAAIESHAPGALIPRDWILEELEKATGERGEVEGWVDIFRAVEITGEDAETLRSRATTWRGVPDPVIRVTKNDPSKLRSPWLFAEEDCWAYRHARDAGPRVVSALRPDPTAEADPDDPKAIASRLMDRVKL